MDARRCWFALSVSLCAALGCGSEPTGGAHERLEKVQNVPHDPSPNDPPPREENPPNGEDDPGEQPDQDAGTPDDGQCVPVAEGGKLDGDLPIMVTGSVVGMHNDYVIGPPACRESETNASEDVTYAFTAKEAGTYRFTSWVPGLSSVQTGIVMTIASPTCGAQEITCQAYDVPAGIDVTLTAGQTVLVVIDPWSTLYTDYTLTIDKK